MLNTVTEINEASKRPNSLIEYSEKHFLTEVYDVAQKIADNDDIKIVALAGPSGSGKTTTAHILCDRLGLIGEKTTVVSLDDFYLEREKLPKLPDGTTDYESVDTLNIPLINKCFNEIIATGKTMLPRFDFKNGVSIPDDRLADITDRGIIIAEGLHALNPIITDLVPQKNIFKIYISVNCSIEDSFGEQLLSSRLIRLIRRTIRDSIFRNSGLEKTLSMWNNVVEGERKYLYPYKNSADAKIRTLHSYEPLIYRDKFLEIVKDLKPEYPNYEYVLRAANAIEKFESMDSALIPKKSLVREFIGDGKYN